MAISVCAVLVLMLLTKIIIDKVLLSYVPDNTNNYQNTSSEAHETLASQKENTFRKLLKTCKFWQFFPLVNENWSIKVD